MENNNMDNNHFGYMSECFLIIKLIFLLIPKCYQMRFMLFNKAINTQLNGVYPFTTNKLNSNKTRDDVSSMIVLKSMKFILYSLMPTLSSKSLIIRLMYISNIKSSLNTRKRKTTPIQRLRNPSRLVGCMHNKIRWWFKGRKRQ